MVGQDPASLLRGLEKEWRDRLRSVNLVAELQLTKQELNTALYCLGLAWKRERSAAHASSRIQASYPATFVVAVAGSASMHVVGNKVLPQLFEAAGLHYDGNLGREWGQLFLGCLAMLRLPTFEELTEEQARPYVSRMLLHGGIPLDQVDEWFEVATAAVKALPDGRASELQAWMVQRASEKRLYGTTTSIDRFLRFGQQYAADFLDRSLELLDAVQNGAEAEEIRVGLPPRYVERAIELRELGELPSQLRRDRLRGVSRDERPEVRFDPYGLGVYLRLPPVSGRKGGVTWRTSLAGRVESMRLVPSRPGLPTEPGEVPIPVGLADVVVQLDDDQPTTLRLIDPDDPLVLFTTEEVRLPSTGTLPRGPIWVVRPEDREVETAGGRLVEEHPSVARWPGWVAELWDLSDATSFRLNGARRHGLQTERTARLDDVQEIASLTAPGGYPVLANWPTLHLPSAPTGARWTVRIESADEEQAAEVEIEVEVGPEGRSIELRTIAEGRDLEWRPSLLRARGPLGRSLRRSMLVLPDVAVVSTPTVRTPGPEGLSPTRIQLRGTDHPPVDLPPDQLAATVRLGRQDLIVEPPSVSIEYVVDGRSSVRRHRPIALGLEQLSDDTGSLLVRLPTAGRAELLVHSGDGAVQQRVPSTRPLGRDGAGLFELRRCRDTLTAQRTATLSVEADTWSGRVATIRPARLVEHVVAQAERRMVQFVGVAGTGVAAAWYSRLVPTREPVVETLPPGDPSRPVPDDLLGLGPLRVLLQVDDPWVPPTWPTFPPQRDNNTFDVDLPVDPASNGAGQLAGYLAAIIELDQLTVDLDDVVAVLEHLPELDPPRPTTVIRQELTTLLVSDPAASLVALARSGADEHLVAQIACESGLVATSLAAEIDIQQADELWTRWPALGVLATVPWLERSDATDAAVQSLTHYLGASATDLLAGRDHQTLELPKLEMPQLLEWDQAILDAARGAAGLVPRGSLHPDARAASGFQIIERLRDAETRDELYRVASSGERSLNFLLSTVIGPASLPHLEAAITRRIQGPGWQQIPALSLAYATCARLAARSEEPMGIFGQRSRLDLAALAAVLPSLVAADLSAAELLIRGARA